MAAGSDFLAGVNDHAREFRLLLALLRDERELGHELLSDPSIDWDYLIRAVEFHGLIPVVARFVKETDCGLPHSIGVQLDQAGRQALQANVMLAGELMRVLRLLNAAGIECLPFKGPAMAAQLWGDFTLRQSIDLDLLVHRAQVPEAISCLAETGYCPQSGCDWRKSLETSVELSLHKPRMLSLELQWGIAPAYFSVDFDFESSWERSPVSDFAGQRIRMFAPEDLLLILCIHGWKHAWNRLLWAADIAKLLQTYRDLEWDFLLSGAGATRLESVLLLGLKLTSELFAVKLPREVESRVARGPAAKQLETATAESVSYMKGLTQPSYIGWHRYMLRARERRVDRFRHVSRFLLTTNANDWHSLRLPGLLGPFYQLVRLARVGHVAVQYAWRRD